MSRLIKNIFIGLKTWFQIRLMLLCSATKIVIKTYYPANIYLLEVNNRNTKISEKYVQS